LTVTYANGASGVGATLTNAGAQAAIALDGVTLALNDRVLVKNQAAPAQNGIYFTTTLGDGTHNWVLTRVTDYDQAAEVLEGTATIIEEGTVNASHIYVMTDASVVTMGTSSIDFTSLTANATSANTLTTPRAIYGNNFDGSAALTQIIASTYGGTGNGWTKFSGCTTSEKTKTVRDASDTILELGGSYTPTGTWTSLTMVTPVLGTPASGNLANCTGFPSSLPTLGYNVQTGAYAPTTTDQAKIVSFIGASGDATWTIVAGATNGANWWCILDNPTTHTITLLVTTNTIDGYAGATGFKMYPGETRLCRCDGTNYITRVLKGFWINTQTTFTFSVPPGYQAFDCEIWGGGGGGKVAAAGSNGGGGGGSYNCGIITAANMGSTTQTCTVGAGGNATSSPTAGGQTSIGSLLNAFGGGAGNSAGGGGGGTTSVGANGGASTVGGAGGGIQGASNTGAGGSAAVGNDGLGGGGGGGTGGGGASLGFGGGGGGGQDGVGGNALYGGGGGSAFNVTTRAGGSSVYGGAGGSNTSVNGVAPGGGGAGHAATSGTGGSGQIWIRGLV
jgi:hypothetical protein